jgi:hypothetical protein
MIHQLDMTTRQSGERTDWPGVRLLHRPEDSGLRMTERNKDGFSRDKDAREKKRR